MWRTFLCLSLMAGAAWGQGRNAPRGKAGEFDFYLLAMSWSPQYCSSPAGARDTTQCGTGRRYEFILHGLWPQYDRGWPQFCATSQSLSNALVEKMMDVMPSRRLVRHGWVVGVACMGTAGFFLVSRHPGKILEEAVGLVAVAGALRLFSGSPGGLGAGWACPLLLRGPLTLTPLPGRRASLRRHWMRGLRAQLH
jgi:hypothetical protein